MRIVVALLLAVVAASTARAQNFESVETVNLKGAYGVVVIPKDWNGSLFIYAHGYSADERILQPFPQDLTPGNFTTKLPILFQASVLPALLGKYAVATTTFRSVGWYIGDAVKDIENLRRYFVKKHGKPKFTYIWGHSAGGMVTQAVIEYFPRTYDGAMPMCGVGAGGTSTAPSTCACSTSTSATTSRARSSGVACAATGRAAAWSTRTAPRAGRAARSRHRRHSRTV
jgi:pimeloyl-ACP methyl ester carboxylesterase